MTCTLPLLEKGAALLAIVRAAKDSLVCPWRAWFPNVHQWRVWDQWWLQASESLEPGLFLVNAGAITAIQSSPHLKQLVAFLSKPWRLNSTKPDGSVCLLLVPFYISLENWYSSSGHTAFVLTHHLSHPHSPLSTLLAPPYSLLLHFSSTNGSSAFLYFWPRFYRCCPGVSESALCHATWRPSASFVFLHNSIFRAGWIVFPVYTLYFIYACLCWWASRLNPLVPWLKWQEPE